MASFARTVLFSVLILSAVSGEALAHTPGGMATGGFVSGFIHPFGGLDHLLATVAAGDS